jgi:tetratricopeptide (TPR) repeat protein
VTLAWRRYRKAVPLIGLLIFLQGCVTAPSVSTGELPLLIDPRLGFDGPSTDALDKKLAAAWKKLSSGQIDAADKAFASLATKHPGYAPATVGRAVVALSKGQVDLAERYVEKAADPGSSYFAAEAYRAEVALARDLTEDAWRNYKRISELPGAPTIISTRLESVTDSWFDELVARAQAAGNEADRIALLSEAVEVRPRSDATRIALARALADARQWDRARDEVGVLLDRGLADNPDVQRTLAELDASSGRYQDAIVRLERLVQRYPGRGHEARLSEIKFDYMRANLPPRYHRALAAQAITRADLAILAYWHVSLVRFAGVSESPIAVDIASTSGRDEIVRALGLGLLTVDSATRAFGPDVTVTSRAFLNLLGRLARLAPVPACAGGLAGTEGMTACGVDLSAYLEDPNATVSGARAVETLNAVDRFLGSGK